MSHSVRFVVSSSFRLSEMTQWRRLLESGAKFLLGKNEVVAFASLRGDRLRFMSAPKVEQDLGTTRNVWMDRTFRVEGGNLNRNPELVFKYATALGLDVTSLKKRVLDHIRKSERARLKAA